MKLDIKLTAHESERGEQIPSAAAYDILNVLGGLQADIATTSGFRWGVLLHGTDAVGRELLFETAEGDEGGVPWEDVQSISVAVGADA